MIYTYNGWNLIPYNSKDIIDLIHCGIYPQITNPTSDLFKDIAKDILTKFINDNSSYRLTIIIPGHTRFEEFTNTGLTFSPTITVGPLAYLYMILKVAVLL